MVRAQVARTLAKQAKHGETMFAVAVRARHSGTGARECKKQNKGKWYRHNCDLCCLSISISISLYLSLSRRKRTWTPVRIALHKSSCSPAGGSHPRRGASCCCTLRRLRPRRSQHNALRGDSMLIGMAGRDPGQPTCRKPVAYASPALNTTIRVPAGRSPLSSNGPSQRTAKPV